MSDISTAELREWREESREWARNVRADIRGVNDRLDMLNGRTRAVETKIAVLEERTSQQPGKGPAVAWGSMAGGVVVGIIEAIKTLSTR